MNKKGVSLVELLAIIVIMGVIAAIAVPISVVVINRQKRNATVAGLNNIYTYVKGVLSQDNVDIVVEVDPNYRYTTLTSLYSSGSIEGEIYIDSGMEIYFCFNGSAYAVAVDTTAPATMPSTTTNSSSFTTGGYQFYWNASSNLFTSIG